MPHTVAMKSSRRNMLQPPFDLYLRPRITNPCEAIQQPESAWQISIWIPSAQAYSQFFSSGFDLRIRSFRRSFLIGEVARLWKKHHPSWKRGLLKDLWKFFINHHLTKRLLERWSWQMTTGLKCKDWWLAKYLRVRGITEACFLCQGTGRRRAAEEYVYGKEAMQHEDQRMREVESAWRRSSQNYLFRALHWRRATATMWGIGVLLCLVQTDEKSCRPRLIYWRNKFHTIYPSTTNVSCAWAQGR